MTATPVAQGVAASSLRNRGISAAWAPIAAASWIVAIDNWSFWKTLLAAQETTPLFMGVVALSLGLVLVGAFGTVLRALRIVDLAMRGVLPVGVFGTSGPPYRAPPLGSKRK